MNVESLLTYLYYNYYSVIQEAHSCVNYLGRTIGSCLGLLHGVKGVVFLVALEFTFELLITLIGSREL